jgi:hypothetical protein
MGNRRIGRRSALGAVALATLALALPAGSMGARAPREPKPIATTGAALHILPTSAQLTATVNPNGTEASYYFQYGPTVAYGSQTPTLPVPAGTTPRTKVGQPISGLVAGTTYHFRVVAIDTHGAVVAGRDHVFIAKAIPLKVELDKPPTAVVGTPFVLSGTLRGLGAAAHRVILEATSYPYEQAFTVIGPPALSNASGRFSFRVANIGSSTEFRVSTVDPRPLYSPTVTVRAAVRVVLHASRAHAGLVRLYGTVTPAVTGAKVFLQLHKTVRGRPGTEPTAKFVSQFTTVVKKAGRGFSRFSVVVAVREAGRYRAYVRLRPGPSLVESGVSSTVVLRASPLAKRKR